MRLCGTGGVTNDVDILVYAHDLDAGEKRARARELYPLVKG
jgi:hypothetical protein